MSIALGIAALVGISAITPGPNNVAIMAAAAHRGFRGALPAIAGVVAGSLVMVLLTAAGVGAILASAPAVTALIAIVGCAYLGWLGLRMIGVARGGARGAASGVASGVARSVARSVADADRPDTTADVRSGFAGLFLFQFLNPKGWTMVLTAVATAQSIEASIAGTAWLLGIFLIVPVACLSLWALSGAILSRQLARPEFRRRFDRFMGATLVLCALLLLVDAWKSGTANLWGN